ncbi:HD domain-containing protein [Gammaproteobacteria bacterium LSUCC0112]|nr:HD domain-containing protein [Gammaproteobacteria bacterium LSUCC0112]
MHNISRYSSNPQKRLHDIHSRLLNATPSLDRIACAFNEPRTDELSTFFNSTRSGVAPSSYHYRLSDSTSLSDIKNNGLPRVIDRISELSATQTEHSRWLQNQGYQSSCTVAMYDKNCFSGLIFFDSSRAFAFTETVQRDLLQYSSLINMTINTKRAAVSSVLSSVKMARDFAQLRDFETGSHLNRIALYAEVIARRVASAFQLSDEAIALIKLFAPLHDIGKIGIPDQILLKNGQVSQEERIVMQLRVTKGEQIARQILKDFNLERHIDSRIMLNIIACHHEYLDGSGYPRGLKGDEIPIETRIITVADIFDAQTCLRPHKLPWMADDALNELENLASSGKLYISCVNALKYDRDAIVVIMASQQDNPA